MRSILLSYTIDKNTPFYIGTTKPTITPNDQISMGADYNTYIITIGNHCGTHIDAPRHFIPTGRKISDYGIQELTFNNPLILDCPKGKEELIKIEDVSGIELEGKDCLFFRTGFGKYRKNDPDTYLTYNPGIAPEVIPWIRENFKSIRCLGIDCVSITSYQQEELGKISHIAAFKEEKNLGDPLLLIEDMNLDIVSRKDQLNDVIVLPWQIREIDSAPCTVVANIKK